MTEPVLQRAFQYWRNVDKNLGDKIESGVRAKQSQPSSRRNPPARAPPAGEPACPDPALRSARHPPEVPGSAALRAQPS